jgi:Mg2+ and Co2+ transporter CorA
MIARVFRAGKPEEQVEELAAVPREPAAKELVWVDVQRDEDVAKVLAHLGFSAAEHRLTDTDAESGVARLDDIVLVTVNGLSRPDDGSLPRPSRVDLLARENVVVTMRDEEVAGLGDLVDLVQGRSELGSLDAASFAAILLEGLIAAFFDAVEDIERDIDEVDDRALGARSSRGLVNDLTALRRRIAVLRRTLVPHRSVVAALARPELGLTPGGPDPWPGLLDRLERAIDAVENARELLLGSFDLVMTQTAQRTNDIVRVLTVVSVTLLPAGVLAGIFGMNFESPIFEGSGTFLLAAGLIAGISVLILLAARWRGWL